MMDSARVLYAKRASHDKTPADAENKCKLNRPAPQIILGSTLPKLRIQLT
jgi:hypothetical protein